MSDMTEEDSSKQERFNAYDEIKKLGWRIDGLMDTLDTFNSRIRSNTARISRVKASIEGAEEEEGEELEEEREEEIAGPPLSSINLHELTPGQIAQILARKR